MYGLLWPVVDMVHRRAMLKRLFHILYFFMIHFFNEKSMKRVRSAANCCGTGKYRHAGVFGSCTF